MERFICDGLDKYIAGNNQPWHMPGHKRSCDINSSYNAVENLVKQVEAMDVTEVPGMDDLHNPKEMIKKSMDELKKVYGTYASYYLVNGSTCGIFTAIASCVEKYDKKDIILAYNCHKSVYNAVYLLKLNPVVLCPKGKYISVDDMEALFEENPDINPVACVLTSPSYEGVCIDVKAIKQILEKQNIKLIVDEAHGAHFNYMNEMPVSAVKLGADIVIQSLHKTLASLTQTAILHNQCEELDDVIKKYLSVFMTSSPSYIFLSSMELAIADCVDRDYSSYIKDLKEFRTKAAGLSHIEFLDKEHVQEDGGYDYDISRIVFSFRDKNEEKLPGDYVEKELSKYGIVCEMSGIDYVVLISTYMDSKEAFDKLYAALECINKDIKGKTKQEILKNRYVENKKMINELDKIERLKNKKACADIYVYPPGIPIVKKEETVGERQLEILKQYIYAGKELRGL